MANLVQDPGECQRAAVTECLLFSDKRGYHNNHPYILSPPLYERCTANVLGADDEDEPWVNGGVSHCFNCGSAYHTVSSCLVPHNTELITLSRQMYNFFKPARPTEPMTISAAAEFTNQRHQWLGSFEPGQVRGSVLREALGLDDDDVGSKLPWLKNMADWGYPRGWFSEEDPREQVFRRIDGLFAEPLDLGSCGHSLTIFGDDGVELLDMGVQLFHNSSSHEETDRSQNFRYSPVMRADRAEQVEIERGRRWASYPSTHFSSDILPIYNGTRLPPILPTTSSTFTNERHLLWESISHSSQMRELRGPHDTGNIPQHVPYPPIAPPPPLPPLPPLVPAAEADDVQNDGESDMELSDSDY
ncbi:hypothetical protein BJV78DRAFT_1357761 [Lactifluus subvellereus]|nr:hypothetical protein BJV78DRAFT_1357761 [Lactifluus subvellereus]